MNATKYPPLDLCEQVNLTENFLLQGEITLEPQEDDGLKLLSCITLIHEQYV